MAFRLFNIFSSITKSFGHSSSSTNGITSYLKNENFNLVKSCLLTKNIVRQTSFFNKYTAAELWKSSTSVSNQGRARGRGRGTRFMIKDLNRGQVIGVGKVNMLWPGLSGPIMKGSAVVQQQRLPDDPEREAKLIKARKALTKRSRRVHPLERGWTSARLGGRSIGAPDPVGEEKFENFDTKVIEHKIVQHMTGNFGRKRSFSTFAITGNKNGLCGIAIGRSAEAKAALRVAKNRAGQKLMYIERYNDHTVLHDFYTTFGATKVLVEKKPEGFGLRAHRAIVCACQVIGIKDIRCKVEGAMNYQHIIKAFLLGLLKQKSHQQLAEEKQLYLVEMRKENFYYPKVIAKPSVIRKPSEVKSTEITDFNQYVLGGKVVHQKKKYPPFFTSHYSWVLRTRKNEYLRNQDKVKIRLRAEYGELRSFLTDKYPEAKPSSGWWIKNKEEAEI